MKNKRIAIVTGGWAQNIGNAFYDIGGRFIFENIVGPENVFPVQTQPGYRTLHNKLRGNPRNYANTVCLLEIDVLVIQGPVFNLWLRANWEDAFRILYRRGVKIVYHSAAFFKFWDVEIDHVISFLQDYPPHAIITRDKRSYEILQSRGICKRLALGIDAGFFVSDAYTAPRFHKKLGPYAAFTFDRYPEPNLRPCTRSASDPLPKVELDGMTYSVHYPKIRHRLAHQSKIMSYVGELIDWRKLPERIGDHLIIRPEHRHFPHITHKIYKNPNGFASDEPWTYLNVYANVDFTLSDRVHACVATLAYGQRAMLFTPSPRSGLFEHLEAGDIQRELVAVPDDLLITLKSKHVNFVGEFIL